MRRASRAVIVIGGMALLPGLGSGRARGQDVEARPGYEATVQRPGPDQEALSRSREHCSADPDRLADIGAGAGQQVRIYRGSDRVALFTVEALDEDPERIVRMGEAARLRLGTSDPFHAVVSRTVARSMLSDAEADAQGELVERLADDGSQTKMLILAPHGGEIEASTDKQADRLRDRLGPGRASTWSIKGFDPPGPQTASGRWHITSTDIHEASFPMLSRVAARRYEYALSFHGMSGDGILIGGGAPMEFKLEIRAALERAVGPKGIAIRIAQPGGSLSGTSPRNVVNRYCPGTGIQLEQSSLARREHWQAIADAVADIYLSRL